jgi:hypothetical protein
MEQIDTQPDQPSLLYPRIESDPQILGGKPIIQGSRLTVETILENIASGYTLEGPARCLSISYAGGCYRCH